MSRTSSKVFPVLLSPCLLLILLALAFLHPVLSGPSVQRSLSIEEEELDQEPSSTQPKKKGQWLKKNYKKVIDIPGEILPPPLGTLLKSTTGLIPEADTIGIIHSELNALNARLDIFYEELKWASNDYQKAVDNIENSWVKYFKMAQNKAVLENIFFPFYSQFVDSALVLHRLLTTKPVDNTQSLGDVLAKKLRCHENDVTAQFLYLNQLIYKGNVMDEKYYEFKGIKSEGSKKTAEKTASESSLALFKSHQKCVSNSDLYIRRDIIERIDDGKIHQKIANEIGAFLQKTYDRYEWTVVAFTTHFSKKMGRFLKRHILSGFGEIQRGTVTVAIAGQLKGSYTKIDVVKQAIAKCLGDVTKCDNIDEKVMKCKQNVLNKKVSQTVTAVHMSRSKSQSFIQSPHGYTGTCEQGKGHFNILIKSDEEITGENPCNRLKCENGGKCNLVPRTFIPMCECPYPFYGKRCENSFNDFKKKQQLAPKAANIVSQYKDASIISDQLPQTHEAKDGGRPSKSRSVSPNSHKIAKKRNPLRHNKDRKQRKQLKNISVKGQPRGVKNRKAYNKSPKRPQSPKRSGKGRVQPRGVKKQKASNKSSKRPQSPKGSVTKTTSLLTSSAQTKDAKSFCGSLCEE